MEPIGPKLAEGRDSEIYEHGPGKVLRLTRDGRTLVWEAEIMRFARSHGYPVPEVHDAGDGYLVMDRLEGPTMFAAFTKQPWRLGAHGRVLADLHARLHAIEAPDWLDPVPVEGTALLHRDLHPLNVLITADGPFVIDWSNAARGGAAYDVADTWVLLSSAQPPAGRLQRVLVETARNRFLESFLRPLDRDAARRAIPAAVEHRLLDRNMTDGEKAAMRRLAEWAESEGPS